MTKDLYKAKDGKWEFIYPKLNDESPIGEFKSYGNGRLLTILTYGNGLYLSLQAQKDIEKKLGKKIKIIDLMWISDINYETLLKEISPCKKILIVDECRRSGCHGEGILTNLILKSKTSLNIDLHAAEDSFISIGNAATATLPSKDSIVQNALNLVNA